MILLLLILVCDYPKLYHGYVLGEGSFQVHLSVQVSGVGRLNPIEVVERYSDSSIGRGTLKVRSQATEDGAWTIFHCDQSLDACAAQEQSRGCELSSSKDYLKLVYVDTRVVDILQQVLDKNLNGHFMGVFSLFYFITRNQRRMLDLNSFTTSVTGAQVREFELDIGDGRAKLLITYRKLLLESVQSIYKVLPSKVELLEQSGTSLMIVSLKQFNWLLDHSKYNIDVADVTLSAGRDFVMPMGAGCSKVLRKLKREPLPRVDLNSLRISFETCLEDTDKRLPVTSWPVHCSELSIVMDFKEQLLRRDLTLSSAVGHFKTLKTIYDFKANRKYSTAEPDLSRSGCAVTSIRSTRATAHLDKLFPDDAVYMGSMRFGPRRVLVYEHELEDGAPFWLMPSLALADTKQLVDLAGPVSVVFYLEADSEHFKPVMIKILSRGATQYSKLLKIREFNSGRSSASNPFNLATFCCRNCMQPMHVSMLLEPKRGTSFLNWRSWFIRGGLQTIKNPVDRTDIIERSLSERFDFRPTSIDIRSSKLLHKPTSRAFGLAFDFALEREGLIKDRCYFHPEIRVDVVNSAEDLKIYHQVSQVSLEDCFWLVFYLNNLHQATCEGAARKSFFTYSRASNECFILRSTDKQTSGEDVSFRLADRFYPILQITSNSQSSKNIIHEGITNPRLIKSELVNQAFQIALLGHDRELARLELSIKDLAIRAEESSDMISGVRWQSSARENLVWAPQNVDSTSGQSNQVLGRLTSSLCRTSCLKDVNCRSYSFCEGSSAREAECLLSRVDIEENDILGQIEAITSKDGILSRGKRRLKLSNGTEAFVEFRAFCFTYQKRYLEHFNKVSIGHSEIKLDHVDKIPVRNSEECASLCYSHNLQKLTKGSSSDHNQEWSAFIKWRRQKAQSLCTYFYHVETEQQHLCAFSFDNYTPVRESFRGQYAVVKSTLFKLNFVNLYDAIFGLKLKSGRDSSLGPEIRIPGENYKQSYKMHLRGINQQMITIIDNVEQCSQYCILQNHELYPACSSFDFIQETHGNETRRYCQLNSWTYRDLKRHDILKEQVEYLQSNQHQGLIFWHFEPKPFLQIQLDPGELAGEDGALQRMNYKLRCYQAFNSISALIILSSLITGILLSIKITHYWRNDTSDLPPNYSATMRQIHRQSGVNIRSNVKGGEVLM